MTPEQQRVAIAEATGVKPELVEWWAYKHDESGGSIRMSAETREEVERWIARHPACTAGYETKPFYRYPDYTGSLDAMHEAEKCEALMKRGYARYLECLAKACGTERIGALVFATAAQRAEAFLRTLNLWTTT